MGEILFLAHRVPFPPDRGDKIRSYNILKALAELGPVHVGCLAEGEGDLAQAGELAELATSYFMPSRRKSMPQAGLEALASGKPVSLTAFDNAPLRRWVEHTLAERPISAIYVFSGQMGQYVPADFAGRVVMDLVDVDSAKFEAYAAERSGPRRWLYAREGRLLKQVEKQLAMRADMTLLVSEAEAQLLQERAGAGGEIRALCNGIDTARFDPAAVAAQEDVAQQAGPHFVFTGQMDYPPNIAAVRRFSASILPQIRAQHETAQFHIVGRAPTADVRDLARDYPGVRVWGEVPDTRPFLAAATMVVAPLTIARGVQNKVLEAMAMGRPVLTSREAATGIPAQRGAQLLVCEDDAAFVKQALDLLQEPARASTIGEAARAFVKGEMSWPAMLADLPAMMGQGAAELREARNAA